MKEKKIVCILLVIYIITIISFPSFAVENGGNFVQEDNLEKTEQEANQTENEELKINIDTNDLNILNEQHNVIQEKIKQVNERLEYVQGEISDSVLEIQKINDKILKYEFENQELNQKIEKLEKSVLENKQMLDEITKEYERQDNLLKDRLVAIYEAGELSFLDVLLSSTSLSDFLSRYNIMKEIIEYDNKLIDEVAEKRDKIEESKKQLEQETDEMIKMKSKAEINETILRNTKILQEENMETLTEQEQGINEELEKFKTLNAIVESKMQMISTQTEEFEIQYSSGPMIWPVAKKETRISSYFGEREHPIFGIVRVHQGIDIANTGFGAPVVSVLDGVVTYAGELGSYGNCVMIYHGNGITTVYGHGQKILTERGKEVKQGDLIMEVGSTGNSTGPHLHFEVRVNGVPTNPLIFVKMPQ